MDLSKVIEVVKMNAGQSKLLGMWTFSSLKKNGGAGFYFLSKYKIIRIIKENERIKVIANVELFDCWEFFEEQAKKIFSNIIKAELSNQIQEIGDLLDIVITGET